MTEADSKIGFSLKGTRSVNSCCSEDVDSVQLFPSAGFGGLTRLQSYRITAPWL